MIALDTNVLVHAHRSDSKWNAAAYACVAGLARANAAWGLPWPCLHEFFAIVTHPKVFSPPSTIEQAIQQIEAWLESSSAVVIGEAHSHWPTMCELLRAGKAVGSRVHDARIAAICISHGVSELWTVDRDFSRFPQLRTRNPLTGP